MANEFVMLPKSDYNNLTSKLDEILSHLNSKGNKKGDAKIIGEKWVTEKRAQELTGRKQTTLWKMRTQGKLTFTKFNNKVYYDMESIIGLLEQNKTEAYR